MCMCVHISRGRPFFPLKVQTHTTEGFAAHSLLHLHTYPTRIFNSSYPPTHITFLKLAILESYAVVHLRLSEIHSLFNETRTYVPSAPPAPRDSIAQLIKIQKTITKTKLVVYVLVFGAKFKHFALCDKIQI